MNLRNDGLDWGSGDMAKRTNSPIKSFNPCFYNSFINHANIRLLQLNLYRVTLL